MNPYIVLGKGVRIAPIGLLKALMGTLSTYACLVPLMLIDVFVWQFQNIYFRIAEIPCIDRKKYVILDRYKL